MQFYFLFFSLESRIRSNSGELGPTWSLLSPNKWEHNNTNNNPKPSSQYPSGNKSKFFDDFISDKNNNNNNNQYQSNRPYQRSSNTHSTQTSRENGGQYDENGLPVRQPFFSNDRPYPQRQQQQNRYQNDNTQQQNRYQNDSIQPNRYQNDNSQQQNRYQNDNAQYQQRYFYNNRRPQMPNQQRRPGGGGGGGNRETFQDNPTDYDADFDFETSNQKFNKLTTEEELPNNQPLQPQIDQDLSADYSSLYDKKKSFFDNLTITEPSDAATSYMHNRSKNRDTFGNDGYYRQNNRSNGNGYRRSNNNNYRQQQQQYGNEDFQYRQYNNNNSNSNNNGYHYRY